MHLFSGDVDASQVVASASESSIAPAGDLTARVEQLENEVADLKQRLDSLLAHLGD